MHIRALIAARKQTKITCLVNVNAAHTPFSSEQFDVAVALDVMEHLAPGTLTAEAYRLVKPGGILFVSVPSSVKLWSKVDEISGHQAPV